MARASGRGPSRLFRRRRGAPPPPASTALTWEGLAGAVALLAARTGGSGASQDEILGDAPRGPVIAALVVVATAALRELRAASPGVPPVSDEAIAKMLRDLGLLAAEGIEWPR